LDRYVYCAHAIGIAPVIEKMQLSKLGFDLPDDYRSDLWMSPHVVLKNIAESNQEVPPSRIAINLVNCWV